MRGGVQLLTSNPYDYSPIKGGKRSNTGRLGVSLRYYDATIGKMVTFFNLCHL